MKLISTSICAEWKFTAVPIVILKPLICRLDPWECDGIFPVSKPLSRRLHPRECHGIFPVSKSLCRRLHPRECHGDFSRASTTSKSSLTFLQTPTEPGPVEPGPTEPGPFVQISLFRTSLSHIGPVGVGRHFSLISTTSKSALTFLQTPT